MEKTIRRIEKEMLTTDHKKSKLIDLQLEGTIDEESFSRKLFEIDSNLDALNSTLNDLSATKDQQDDLRSRIQSFRATLESQTTLENLDRFVF